jgi:hypothetical protein
VSKNIDCYHNLKYRRNIIFEGIMEIWERYGRDEKNPSRAQALCTTAFPAIMGGMRDFFLQNLQICKKLA